MRQDDMNRIQPYMEMVGDALREAIDGSKDFAGLKGYLKKQGFDLGLMICIGVSICEKDAEKQGDADFLKQMNIRYD